jgi:hypothetical protein
VRFCDVIQQGKKIRLYLTNDKYIIPGEMKVEDFNRLDKLEKKTYKKFSKKKKLEVKRKKRKEKYEEKKEVKKVMKKAFVDKEHKFLDLE